MTGTTNPPPALDTYLEPGETLVWQTAPGATPLSRSETSSILLYAVFAAVIGTTLAGLADVPTAMLPLVFAAVAAVIVMLRRRSDRLSPRRIYVVTNRRVLTIDGRAVRTFRPADIPYLDVQTQDDGTVDLVWGDDRGEASTSDQSTTGPVGRASVVVAQRRLKRGFLGLPSAEPARSLIDDLRSLRHDSVASAVPPLPAVDADDKASAVDEDAPRSTAEGWRTVRHPDLGFAVDVPAVWKCRTARVKRYRFLGIPFEPAPRWSETPSAGWNRLTVETGLETAALQVSLNPDGFPVDLAEVVNDRWARVLNLKTIESSLDVRIGGLSGFSVLQSLEGVGPKVSLGPVTVSGGAIKARLLQKQVWLRGPDLTVHVHYVFPTDGASLREAMERIAQTVRVDR